MDDFHTYFVGSDGLLVHNDCSEAMTRAAEALAKFTDECIEHLTGSIKSFSKTNGVSGGHNYGMFKQYFDDVCMPVKEVSKTPHTDISGIYDIDYKVGAKDYQGNYKPDTWTAPTYKKTVYDPNIISDEQIVSWGKEALAEATPITTPNGQKYIKGVASNGLKYEGWIDEATNTIKSFYPVFTWRF